MAMTKGKWIFISILSAVGIIGGFGIWYFFRGGGGKPLSNKEIDENAENTPPPSGTSWRNDSFPLSKGSKGQNVESLQKYLNAKFNAGLTEDGLFGNGTLG